MRYRAVAKELVECRARGFEEDAEVGKRASSGSVLLVEECEEDVFVADMGFGHAAHAPVSRPVQRWLEGLHQDSLHPGLVHRARGLRLCGRAR